jgi:major capsid protein gp7
MATIGNTVLTLADWAKRLDPDGQVPMIVELLSQTNEIIQDQLWMEGNLPTGHRVTVRTSLPSVQWRLLNQGVTPSKSTTAQVDEQAGMLESFSEVDKDLCELNGNTAAFRLSEAQAFLESMNQEYAQTLFYGNNGIAPEEFTGLSPRYALSSGVTGQNVVRAGGAGADNASVWLIAWGANTVFGVFPKGSRAGLIHEDLGLETVQTGTGIGTGRMRAYRDHWQWKAGLVVKDWRYAVRICNIDISNLVTESSAADLIKQMLKAIHRLPSQTLGRPVFYANRTILEMLDIQAMSKANLYLTVGNEEGNRKVSLRGIPIRLCDQLLETEATVA